MSRTNCEHCNALVTPGASFCLSCFLPFEDTPAEAPAAEAPAAPYGTPYGSTYGAPNGAPYAAPVPAAVGAQAGGPHDFYAAPAPPQFMHHPGQNVDWRVSAPTAAMLTPSRRQPSRTPLIVMSVIGVLVLVGGFFGAKALFSRPSEKQQFATAFREARPPDLLPSFPDIGSLLPGDGEPEAPGAAQAFVQSIDPLVRAGNKALLDMQGTMDRWADGKVSDDELRRQINALNKTLGAATGTQHVLQAPESTRRGLGKLSEAATEYRLALSALMDWMDSQSGGSRLTYRLTIGSANVHWDEGIINLYRAGGLPAPPLPHPQPKK